MRKVVVKLGGSLITDKSKPFSVRSERILSIVEVIREAVSSGIEVVIVHGGGSFGHFAAKNEIDEKGRLTNESVPRISDAMMELNQIVMLHFLNAGLKTVSFPPHSICLASCQFSTFNCIDVSTSFKLISGKEECMRLTSLKRGSPASTSSERESNMWSIFLVAVSIGMLSTLSLSLTHIIIYF